MTAGVKKERIDRLMVRKGIARSREQAQALIARGLVSVGGRPIHKESTAVPIHSDPLLQQDAVRYASRGGHKLQGALDRFCIDPSGKVILDVGSSTGGFTDCLLQKGARKVFCVDVGYGQLDWRLRQDPRVICLERTNIRYLDPRSLDERVELAVIDVSFISLKKVLPKVLEVLKPDGEVLPLVKPQFEVGKDQVGRGGVVRDPAQHRSVIEEVSAFAASIGLLTLGQLLSPLPGKKGNQEYFLYLKRGDPRVSQDLFPEDLFPEDLFPGTGRGLSG